jgi:hypothetical protein
MRSYLGEMLLVLIAALPQHVPEQDTALHGVQHVFDRDGEGAERSCSGIAGWIRAGIHDLTVWFLSGSRP